MATLNCSVCGKRMLSQTILTQHMAKRHAEGGTVETVVPQPVVEEKAEEMVMIKSADNRKLEVSIGNRYWNDMVIQVPKELSDEVRRILVNGGFFLKD